ncbi:hypothetical protein WN944_012872 [Citrus x changshan-huyou]|uniref:Uncharacterized protein n=1 Tax=Citrus x changshan-huyou TaxID=2935761 RepID=A0AAP0QJY7_9ROSI
MPKSKSQCFFILPSKCFASFVFNILDMRLPVFFLVFHLSNAVEVTVSFHRCATNVIHYDAACGWKCPLCVYRPSNNCCGVPAYVSRAYQH